MKWPTAMPSVLPLSKNKSTVPPSTRSTVKSLTSKASSSTKSKKTNGSVKIVVIAGIALPLIAAIIGVVAWAISADSIHRSPEKSLRYPERYVSSENEEYIDVLESRNDLDHSSNHVFNSYSRAEPISGESDRLMGKDPEKDDPLYVVHFVPSPPTVDNGNVQKTDVSSLSKISSTSDEEGKQLLQKIMDASKKENPGVPQFVVFASLPESQASKDGNNSITFKQTWPASSQNNKAQFDYDYDYVNVGDHSKIKKFIEPGQGASKSENTPEAVQPLPQPAIQAMLQNQRKQQQSLPNLFPIPQPSYVHESSLRHTLQAPLAAVPQSPPLQQQQQHQQQHQQQQQQHYRQSHDQQPLPNIHPVEPHRSGIELPPVGLKLSLGDGLGKSYGGIGGGSPLGLKFSLGGGSDHGHGHGHGYGHGGGLSFSPLGIMATILKPLLPLPRPKAHLNGKVMFGVMLENGLKLGEKTPPHYPHYP